MSASKFSAIMATIAMLFGMLSCSETPAPGDLLDASSFETEIDGKPVSLYTITNGRISAQITNFGGYIVGIYTSDKDGNYTNIVGHNDNIQQYQSSGSNPVGSALGRYANRIGSASFTLDGTEYHLTRNNGQNVLHGGDKGFGKIVWDVENVTRDKLVLSCLLEDGQDGFPGNLKTYLTFSITNDDGVSIDYKATTDKATVCNLSHHVYFNLEGMEAEDVLDHVLMVSADNVTEVDASLIPTGSLLPVDGTAFDFREPVRIGDRQAAYPAGSGRPASGAEAPVISEGMVRSYDQNFCLNHSAEGKVELVASLYSPQTGRYMEVLNNHPGMQIFTGRIKAIAMESQMYPDSPNHPEFPSTVLRPGETYRHTVIYRFSVK